jgi:hypothetical protein
MTESKNELFSRACDALGAIMDLHPDPVRFVADVLDYRPDQRELAKLGEWLSGVARAESKTKN